MKTASQAPIWLVVASILFALILEILPLKGVAQLVRPEFLYMVLIYWAIYSPMRVGITIAWFLGLVLDVMHGSWLGLHSLGMIFIVVFIKVFSRRIRMFGRGKQIILIASLILIANTIYFILQFSKWNDLSLLELFAPAVISAMLWPALVFFLTKVVKGPELEYL